MVSGRSSAPVRATPEEMQPLTPTQPRPLERTIIDTLQAHPGLNVCSLVVHRCPEGLCVEGRVILIDPEVNLGAIIAEIDASTPILNRVMVSGTPVEATT